MSTQPLERYLFPVTMNGLTTDKDVYIGITPGKTPNLHVAGNLTVAGTVTSNAEVIGAEDISATSANAFSVGQNGTTNPAFNVDTLNVGAVTGLDIVANVAGSGVNLNALSTGTNEGMNINAKGSGTLALQNNSTGALYIGSNTSVHSASPNALAVGANDVTNPAFNVDASTASSANGLNVKSSAAGSGVFLAAISSATNENISLNAKGSGSINIGTLSNGGILLGNTTTVVSNVGLQAGGASYAVLLFGSASGFGIYYGSGAPTVSAAQGSLYMRSDGSSTSTRFYVNNSSGSGTSWTAVTTAA
jgi:hypothetical protein